MKNNYFNKKVLIIGLGLSGRSAAQFLLNQNASVIGVDRQISAICQLTEMENLKQRGMETAHDSLEVNFSSIDLVILSPGISPTHTLVKRAKQLDIEVIGEIELGCRVASQSILAVTGTNGKTTVTLLVNHVLNCSGFSSKALGNVGVPLTQEIVQNSTFLDTIVLELSSYQLETMQQKVFDAGLLLNITPDHLDRYVDMENYAAAKGRLGKCLKSKKNLFIEYETWQNFSELFKGISVQTYGYTKNSIIYSDLQAIYYQDKDSFALPNDLQGQPTHELENLMGAYALCSTKGVSGNDFIKAYQTFKKPPHRIQYVDQVQGVHYFDDSKGTNINAVVRAVESLKGPIILIAGGLHKGVSYLSWKEQFKGKVNKIFAIGQAASRIHEDLNGFIPVEMINGLENAVLKASQIAKKGDYVLLSPGCASQDMFKDYVHRGEVFQKTVQSLVNKEKIKNV